MTPTDDDYSNIEVIVQVILDSGLPPAQVDSQICDAIKNFIKRKAPIPSSRYAYSLQVAAHLMRDNLISTTVSSKLLTSFDAENDDNRVATRQLQATGLVICD